MPVRLSPSMETGAVLERARASAPPIIRGEPPPLRGGPITVVRFLREHGMFTRKYFRLFARLAWLKLRWRRRLVLDGIAFVGPGVTLEIGKGAKLHLGRWSWIGHGTKIRAHEGEVHIGAKTVMGQGVPVFALQPLLVGAQVLRPRRGVAHGLGPGRRRGRPPGPR